MRALAVVFGIGIGIATAGCVAPSLITCEDGWLCPDGTQCAVAPQPGEARCVSTSCGDGVLGAAEDCDGGELAGRSCTDHGFYGGELACNPTVCRFDTTRCAGTCGDQITNGSEQCDGADQVAVGCTTLGARFDFGRPGCTDQCTFDISPCGYLGFDPIYGGNAAIMRFCAYEPAPGTVIAHALQPSQVIRIEDGADTPLPSLNNAKDYVARDLACTADVLGLIEYGMRWFDGTTWSVVPLAPASSATPMVGTDAFGDSLVSVGYGGLIVTGSGAGWTVEHHDIEVEALQSVWIDPTTQRGYAAGSSGTLMHRTVENGLATWTRLALAAPIDTLAMWGTGDDDVLAATRTIVARLTEGAWITQPVPPGPMHATARDAIFIAGGDGRLSHFDGRVWSRSVDPVGAFVDLWTGSDGSVIAAIGAELVRATGLWLALTTSVNFVTLAPRPGDLPDMWTISRGLQRVTRNGIEFPAPVPLMPLAIAVVDGFAFVAGNVGVARLEPAVSGWQTHATRTMIAVAARDGTHAVAVGVSSTATYAAGVWTEHPHETSALRGIAVVPGGRYVAVGLEGTIVESTDGAAWTRVDPGAVVTADLHGIWTAPDGTAIIVGKAGTILRRDPQGAWSVGASGTTRDLFAVGGTSMTDVFAVGDNEVLQFDGVAWTPMRLPVAGTSFTSVAATARRVYVSARATSVASGTYVLYRTP